MAATKKVNSSDKINNKEPISRDQEEEMSSALIAQILAEDNMTGGGGNGNYYAEYSNRGYDPYQGHHQEQDDSFEENSEDDFDPKKKKYVSKKDVAKRGRKRKAPIDTVIKNNKRETTTETAATETETETNIEASISSIPTTNPGIKEKPSKKAKKPLPEGYNSGVYTELEEKHFLEGLEKFGRDWGELQRLVATRDSNSIRSHAQKHFIKMYRDQVPLPAKVLESGDGYTLSGKPLDPNSAAAKPYLNRHGNVTVNKKVVVESDSMQGVEETDIVQEEKKKEVQLEAVEIQTKELSIGQDDKVTAVTLEKNKKKKISSKSATPSPTNSSSTSDAYDAQGRTNYSTSRLRKQRDATTSIPYQDQDPLTMIKCEPFSGKPKSNGGQPFDLTIESNVLVAMDFHAHLMTTEIIGFLAGEWDKTNLHLHIREAFPCRSIETGQNDVNVEMDPESALEQRHKIEARNLQVVGWYHSHPTFIPDPSLVDIENQRNYQLLCRDEHQHQEVGHVEPFVGAIVGPYDPALPGSASVINWFQVTGEEPKKLMYELNPSEQLSQVESDRLFELLPVYKISSEKVVFNQYWRQDATESKLTKMIKSLASRMPWIQKQLQSAPDQTSAAIEDTFLTQVQSLLKDW